MYENIQIQNNIIEASKHYKIKKLIFIDPRVFILEIASNQLKKIIY